MSSTENEALGQSQGNEESQPGAAEASQEQREPGDIPNPETGVGLGAGESSSFEPEEAPES